MKLFDVYPLFDVNIVKGKGCKVWDEKGQEYLDLYGGHAVISIGHAHPHYIEKVTEQLNKIGFYSNSVINKLQVELAERLGKISGYDDYQLFLINSGAEANENALKLASFTNGRTRVLSCEKAFHGRTSLAVEVTNNPKIIAPINDNSHVTYLPMNDLAAWETELAKGDVCAVILECIQGVVARHPSGYHHRGQGHRQRLPDGSRADQSRVQARLRTIGYDLRRQSSGLRCSTGRARRVRRGESGGECQCRRLLPDRATEGTPEDRAAYRRSAWSWSDDWHRPRRAPQGGAPAADLRAALLHGLRRHQHPAPAAAALPDEAGRR